MRCITELTVRRRNIVMDIEANAFLPFARRHGRAADDQPGEATASRRGRWQEPGASPPQERDRAPTRPQAIKNCTNTRAVSASGSLFRDAAFPYFMPVLS